MSWMHGAADAYHNMSTLSGSPMYGAQPYSSQYNNMGLSGVGGMPMDYGNGAAGLIGGYNFGVGGGGGMGVGGADMYGMAPLLAGLPANQGNSFGQKLKSTGKKLSEKYRAASKDTKKVLGVLLAITIAGLVISVLTVVFRYKKKKIDKDYENKRMRHVAEIRGRAVTGGGGGGGADGHHPSIGSDTSGGGDHSSVIPDVPSELYERHIVKMVRIAQYHHDKAIKTNHPLYKYHEVCMAIGAITMVNQLALPETIHQVTGIKTMDYMARLEECKMETMRDIMKNAPMLQSSAPFGTVDVSRTFTNPNPPPAPTYMQQKLAYQNPSISNPHRANNRTAPIGTASSDLPPQASNNQMPPISSFKPKTDVAPTLNKQSSTAASKNNTTSNGTNKNSGKKTTPPPALQQ